MTSALGKRMIEIPMAKGRLENLSRENLSQGSLNQKLPFDLRLEVGRGASCTDTGERVFQEETIEILWLENFWCVGHYVGQWWMEQNDER